MRIRWTEAAARDLTGICDYIKEHDGPAAARRVALQINGGVGALTRFAHRGRPGHKTGTSRAVVSRPALRGGLSRPRGCRRNQPHPARRTEMALRFPVFPVNTRAGSCEKIAAHRRKRLRHISNEPVYGRGADVFVCLFQSRAIFSQLPVPRFPLKVLLHFPVPLVHLLLVKRTGSAAFSSAGNSAIACFSASSVTLLELDG
jgi:plasmid stabilization system protein ParE